MAMRSEWVDGVFDKLVLVYGQRFQQQWGQVPVAMVKADWAHELDAINAQQLNHALHNLPADHPPNVLQFRDLARQYTAAPMRAAIPMRRQGVMSPAVKARLAQAAAQLREHPTDPLAGARHLRDKERCGVLLTRSQKEFWRTALAREMREDKSREEGQA